jgi:hypothetical protein
LSSVRAGPQLRRPVQTNAKNGQLITAICSGLQVQVAVNGNGEYTPAQVVNGTSVFVPSSFDLTFSFTPNGGTTESETDTSAKHNAKAGSITCNIPAALNTFTTPDGTVVFSGTATGAFTPANGK